MSKKVFRSVGVMELSAGNMDLTEIFHKYKNFPSMRMHFMLCDIIEGYYDEKLKVKGKMSKKLMDYLLEFIVALQVRDRETKVAWLKGGLPYDLYDKEVSDKVPIKDDEFIPDHICDDWNDTIKEFCENEKSLLKKFGSVLL